MILPNKVTDGLSFLIRDWKRFMLTSIDSYEHYNILIPGNIFYDFYEKEMVEYKNSPRVGVYSNFLFDTEYTDFHVQRLSSKDMAKKCLFYCFSVSVWLLGLEYSLFKIYLKKYAPSPLAQVNLSLNVIKY